jgi:hypothetical protein
MDMNPGYLSYIALTVSLILICFGWRSHAIGSSSTGAAVLFCAGWIVSASMEWSLPFGIAGTFAYVPLLLFTYRIFLSSLPRREFASAFSFALLLGAVVSLVQLIQAVDPQLIAFHPVLDPILLLCVLTISYTRNPSLQLVMVSISLLLNDAYMAHLYRAWEPAFLGDRVFQDSWWAAAVSVRAGSQAVEGFYGAWHQGVSRLRGFLRIRR